MTVSVTVSVSVSVPVSLCLCLCLYLCLRLCLCPCVFASVSVSVTVSVSVSRVGGSPDSSLLCSVAAGVVPVSFQPPRLWWWHSRPVRATVRYQREREGVRAREIESMRAGARERPPVSASLPASLPPSLPPSLLRVCLDSVGAAASVYGTRATGNASTRSIPSPKSALSRSLVEALWFRVLRLRYRV